MKKSKIKVMLYKILRKWFGVDFAVVMMGFCLVEENEFSKKSARETNGGAL